MNRNHPHSTATSRFATAIRGKVSLFTTLIALFFLTASLHGQTVTISLETSTTILSPGTVFDVDMILENPDGSSIGGYQDAIGFDPDQLQLIEVILPSEIPGALVPQTLAWNAPEPAGVGGGTGCTYWWDGQAPEAASLVAVLGAGGFSDGSAVLMRFRFQVENTARNGSATISSMLPDLSCGWLGTIVADTDGTMIPTISSDLELTVSDIPPLSNFTCGSAGESVFLAWQEPAPYEWVRIYRDGFPFPDLPAGTLNYEDFAVNAGEIHEYALSGVIGGIESPSVGCTIEVVDVPGGPLNLTCSVATDGAILQWQNPLLWDSIEIVRDGVVIATLAGNASNYLDLSPPGGTSIFYQVSGVFQGVTSEAATCSVEIPLSEMAFIRGDVDADGILTLGDPVTTLNHLFLEGSMSCADAADVNDDGVLDLADGVYLLSFMYSSATPPALPYPDAGDDPTGDGLGCEVGCIQLGTCGAGGGQIEICDNGIDDDGDGFSDCDDSDCATLPECIQGGDGDECVEALIAQIGDNAVNTTSMTTSSETYDDFLCQSTFLGDVVRDAWYTFTAPQSGSMTVSTCGTINFDSDLVIYQGPCALLEQIACNGDGVGPDCTVFESQVENVPVEAGTVYLIRIGGWDSSQSGTGSLNISVD